MIDNDVQKIVEKLLKLRELHRARERVRQLERNLDDAPPKPEEPPGVPEYLRRHTPFRVS
jgi:hypothetical protein